MRDFFIIKDENYDILFNVENNKIFKIKENMLKGNYDDSELYKILKLKIDDFAEKKLQLNNNSKISINFMSSRTCNLGCRYCFAGEGEYGNNVSKPKTMRYDVYKNTLKYMMKKYPNDIETISFFGGEPLLDFKNIKEFIFLLEKVFKQSNIKKPRICISTNSLLLNDDIIEFFKEYNIEVGLSVDGPKYINDLGRRCKSDIKRFSVYDRVYLTTMKLREKGIKYKIQVTLNKNHIKFYKKGIVKDWLDSLGDLIKTDIIVCPVTTENEDFAIKSEGDLKILDSIAREFVHYYFNEYSKENSEKFAAIFISPMLFIINNKVAKACSSGERMILIDTDGDVYPCQMYCNDVKYKLGDVYNGFEFIKENNNTLSRLSNKECSNCIGRNICAVWCKGLQLLNNGSENSVLKERCVFQRAIIEENIKILANLSGNEKGQLKKLFNNIYSTLTI